MADRQYKNNEFIGCSKIYKNGTVTIPKEVLRILNGDGGCFVHYFTIDEEFLIISTSQRALLTYFLFLQMTGVIPQTHGDISKIARNLEEMTESDFSPMISSKLYENGKTTIPQFVRNKYYLSEGDHILFFFFEIEESISVGRSILIRKAPNFDAF